MYDVRWHEMHAEKTRRSAERALTILRDVLAFESALDVGCGNGLWLKVAQRLGCAQICGIDAAWTDRASLHIATDAFREQDLSRPFDLQRRFDLAISLEVAEHVDPAAADTFVANLTRHADLVTFGAAIPYQGGFRHINEQWQSAWRARFAAHDYVCFDLLRPLLWDAPDVHYWYKQNMLVYVNAARTDLVERLRAYMAERCIQGLPIDIVHPEKFEAIASYHQIAFRPLARQLPAQLGAKLKSLALMRL